MKLANKGELYSFSTTHLTTDIKKRAVRSSGATLSSQGAIFLIWATSTMVLARLLTPTDFGLITMVTTLSLLLQNVGYNGFSEVIIQREDLNQDTANAIFWLNAAVSFSLMSLFIAFAPIIARFYREPRLTLITAAVAFSIISQGLSTVHIALLKRRMQFHVTSLIGVISTLISQGLAIFLAWLGLKYWALVASTIAFPLSTAIGSWIFCEWRPRRPSQRANIMPEVRFALNTYGHFALNYGTRNLDNLLVGRYLGVQSLGYYKKAYDLFYSSAGQVVAPISDVALAALSRLSMEHEELKRRYLSVVSQVAFVGIALSVFLTVTAKDIILLILGPQWNKTAEIFTFFGPGIGLMLISNTQGWLHLSMGRADRWFRWGVLELFVTAILFIIGLRFGPSGVAIAWTLSFCALTGPAIWYAGRPVRLKVSALVSILWRYFAAGIAAGLLGGYILHSLDATKSMIIGLNVLLRISVSFLLCTSLYLILIFLLYGSLRPVQQFIALIRDMLPNFSRREKKLK
jgi:O-antigen/teichoic acid export membrane protein